jgi:hypothetical protein
MMAITAEQLTEVARITLAASSVADATRALREILPGMRVSSVDAFDMKNEEPVLHLGNRDLYLMESDGHCWSVTRDPGTTVGIILTQSV